MESSILSFTGICIYCTWGDFSIWISRKIFDFNNWCTRVSDSVAYTVVRMRGDFPIVFKSCLILFPFSHKGGWLMVLSFLVWFASTVNHYAQVKISDFSQSSVFLNCMTMRRFLFQDLTGTAWSWHLATSSYFNVHFKTWIFPQDFI